MHCKLILLNLAGGGAERVALQLAAVMTGLGHDAEIILLENEIVYDIPAGVKVFCLREKMKRGLFQKQIIARELKNYLRGKKVDLAIAFMLDAHRVAQLAKVPNLWHRIGNALSSEMQNSAGKTKHDAARLLRKSRRVYDGANLIAISNGVAEDLTALGIAPKTVRTIHNPVDAADLRRQSNKFTPAEENYIIHVGRFGFQKRHDVLLAAYKKSNITQKLLLLGDDTNPRAKNIRQLARELQLQDKVIFKGFQRNPFPYIKKASALILSSDYEGFPAALTQALALRVPAVSTDCPAGPNEILTNELSQFLSPPGDAEALAKNIKQVIANPPRIEKRHVERFDAVVCAGEYLGLGG